MKTFSSDNPNVSLVNYLKQTIGICDNTTCVNNFVIPIKADKSTAEKISAHLNDQFKDYEMSSIIAHALVEIISLILIILNWERY